MFRRCFPQPSEYDVEAKQGRQRCKVIVLMISILIVSTVIGILMTIFPRPTTENAYASPSVIQNDSYETTLFEFIPEVQADLVMYRHRQTGAEVMTLIPTDSSQDSVFGISFRTIPSSSNGVAHIMEHSVLDGSEKYPSKDPFNQLLRGSLQTFLNAFTYDDRTVYALASRNAADFRNLVGVYLDAVFKPKAVTDEGSWILSQEGWRIEQNTTSGNLTLKGVVLSEMQGAYSDPDELILRYAQTNLFPTNSYRYDSGGEPSRIPTLQREQFLDFYEKFYHPTNSQIYFFGPLEHVRDGLEQTAVYLQDYDARPDIRQESRVRWQEQQFSEPVRDRKPYPSSSNDGDFRILVSWLLNEHTLDTKTELAWLVISQLLLGSPSSVLLKALKDSGYGDDVIGDGVDAGLLQLVFHVGMQGITDEDTAVLVENLIMDTLDSVVATGFSDDEIASALNTVEFQLRELSSGDYPRGLGLLLASLSKWNYDRDPRTVLKFEKELKQLRELIDESGSDYFVSLIQLELASNTHRAVTVLHPSASLELQTIQDEQIYLDRMKQQLSSEQFQALLDMSASLARIQATDDTPEALAAIPTLSLEDLSPDGYEYPITIESLNSIQIVSHLVPSSFDIAYVDFGLDISMIDLEDIPFFPLLLRLMVESGTAKFNEVQLAQQIGIYTGGISMSLLVEAVQAVGSSEFSVTDGTHLVTKAFIRGKCTASKISELLSLFNGILFHGVDFSKEKTISTLREMISDQQDMLGQSGHTAAARRLRARYSVRAYIYEQLYGVSNLLKLTETLDNVQSDWGILLATLNRIRTTMLNGHRNGMILNLTGDEQVIESIRIPVKNFIRNGVPYTVGATPFQNYMEMEHSWVEPSKLAMSQLPVDEGIVISTRVSYVGKGGMIYQVGERVPGSAAVVTQFLQTGYLYENLRLQRGAYGAMAKLTPYSGVLEFLTYRDPNLVETLRVYERAAATLLEVIDASDVLPSAATEAIIGMVGTLDGSAPQPDQLGWESLRQHLAGETKEMRQAWRIQILATSKTEYIQYARRLPAWESPCVVVVSSQAIFDEAESQGVTLDLLKVS